VDSKLSESRSWYFNPPPSQGVRIVTEKAVRPELRPFVERDAIRL